VYLTEANSGWWRKSKQWQALPVVAFLYIAVAAATPELQELPLAERLGMDIARDERSKPNLIVPLLALKKGDRVMDIFAGGGYYSEILARLVGDTGEVLLHNNRGFRAWGINILNARFNDRQAPANITRYDREMKELGLAPESLDAAIMVMAFHDLYVVPTRYNGEKYVPVGKPADVDAFGAQILKALRPGGRFVVIDHAAADSMSRAEALQLHRIHEKYARAELERLEFDYVGRSDVLSNPADDYEAIVFDPHVKGHTDRFVLIFQKGPVKK